jgi:hypothetical protein
MILSKSLCLTVELNFTADYSHRTVGNKLLGCFRTAIVQELCLQRNLNPVVLMVLHTHTHTYQWCTDVLLNVHRYFWVDYKNHLLISKTFYCHCNKSHTNENVRQLNIGLRTWHSIQASLGFASRVASLEVLYVFVLEKCNSLLGRWGCINVKLLFHLHYMLIAIRYAAASPVPDFGFLHS